MKNKFNVLVVSGLLAFSVANAGPVLAAKNLKANVQVAVVHLSDVMKKQLDRSKDGIFGLYDKTKDSLKIIVTGKSIPKILNTLQSNAADVGKGTVDYTVDTSTDALVLSGDAVDWSVKTTLGFVKDVTKGLPGSIVLVKVGDKAEALISSLTGALKTAGTCVLVHSGALVKDTLNLVEEVGTDVVDAVFGIFKK